MEVMVVVILIVLLFPPRELPKIARTAAQLYGQLRKTADDFRSAVMMDDELRAPIREIRSVYHDARYEIEKTRSRMQDEFHRAAKDIDEDLSLESEGELDHEDDALNQAEAPEPPSEAAVAIEPEQSSAVGGSSDPESTGRADDDGAGSSPVESSSGVQDAGAGGGAASQPPPRRVQITAAKRAPRLRAPAGRVPQGEPRDSTAKEPAGVEEPASVDSATEEGQHDDRGRRDDSLARGPAGGMSTLPASGSPPTANPETKAER
jgi:Sec-independent protein translocase protein TatA